ncbi:MAG: GerMN domain-containing protein [Acidimicrobiales bacterium]
MSSTRTGARRPGTGLLLLAAAAIGLSGCALSPQASPQPVEKKSVPFGLLASSTSTPTTAPAAGQQVPVRVYMAGRTTLVPVQRSVTSPLTLKAVLTVLLDGPTNAEAARGIQTAISSQTAVISAHISYTGTALINLNSAFAQITGQSLILAVAQIVYTTTSIPGVTSVRFALSGHPVEVPTQNGTLTKGPLTTASFAALAPKGPAA